MSRFLCVVSFVAISLACSDPVSDPAVDPSFAWANPPSCAADAPAVSLSAARHDSLPGYPAGSPLTLDEAFYRAAQHTPGGFAGFYLVPVNGRNTNVVMFVDTTNVSAALDSLTKYYPGSHRSFARDSVVLRLVRWNWEQLYDWYRYITSVAGLPNAWFSTDIQEDSNRVRIGALATVANRDLLVQRLRQLDVPCWLAGVVIEPGCGTGGCNKTSRPQTGSGP